MKVISPLSFIAFFLRQSNLKTVCKKRRYFLQLKLKIINYSCS